ncbi:MAG: phosphatase PAP2 family protein [Alistipes sp.]|nr:phosphatase PAP2 family protein [Alistipes sp.]
MNDITWDWALFELLNFDGPTWLDIFMTKVSGMKTWLPLYALILYMVWRRHSWRGVLAFIVAIGVAILLADLVAGIFKHQGPLKDLWASFPARLRPLHTPEGVDFAANGYYTHNLYGTVSGHTSTITAIAILTSVAVERRWFTALMITVALLICYSRIYLSCHFPQDILLGAIVGIASGLISTLVFRCGLRLGKHKA